jgi:hypothetical protein
MKVPQYDFFYSFSFEYSFSSKSTIIFSVYFVAAILSLIYLDLLKQKKFFNQNQSTNSVFLCLFAKNNIELLWSEIIIVLITFILFLFHINCLNNKAKDNIGFFCNNLSEDKSPFFSIKEKTSNKKVRIVLIFCLLIILEIWLWKVCNSYKRSENRKYCWGKFLFVDFFYYYLSIYYFSFH